MIAKFIAALGQNIQFVAFWAHLGVGALLTLAALKFSRYGGYAALAVIVGGAIKEFWFDARDENDPPQTFTDNLEDFIGWALGPVVAWWLR